MSKSKKKSVRTNNVAEMLGLKPGAGHRLTEEELRERISHIEKSRKNGSYDDNPIAKREAGVYLYAYRKRLEALESGAAKSEAKPKKSKKSKKAKAEQQAPESDKAA